MKKHKNYNVTDFIANPGVSCKGCYFNKFSNDPKEVDLVRQLDVKYGKCGLNNHSYKLKSKIKSDKIYKCFVFLFIALVCVLLTLLLSSCGEDPIDEKGCWVCETHETGKKFDVEIICNTNTEFLTKYVIEKTWIKDSVVNKDTIKIKSECTCYK
jgi:hypothetical protein